MTPLFVFIATFITVFALGFQSQNVNQGHYKAAMFTSLAIGAGNLYVLRIVPAGDIASLAAYLSAGPLAITASMWVHEKTLGKRS